MKWLNNIVNTFQDTNKEILVLTSSAFLINDAATKSMLFWQPNFKSSISFGDNAGKLTETLGKFIPFFRIPAFFCYGKLHFKCESAVV